MPKSGSVDIPHVSIHDHNIRTVDSPSKVGKAPPKAMDSLKVKGLKSYNNDQPNTRTLAKAYLFYFEKFRSKAKFLDSARSYLKKLPKSPYQTEWVHYYYLKQDFRQVRNFLEDRDSIRLDNPRAAYQAGQAYANLNRYQKAEDYYKKAVKAKPYNLNYQNKLATAYIENKKLAKAERTLTFLLKENPKQPIAQNNLGFIYLTKQSFQKARKHFQKALRLNPDYGRPALNLAKVYLGKRQFSKASKQLQKVRQKYPNLREEAMEIQNMMDKQLNRKQEALNF